VNLEILVERLFQALITGDRAATTTVVDEARDGGMAGEALAHDLYWPVLEMVSSLYRADQLSTLAHHYATRLMRRLIDQAQVTYTQQAPTNRKVLMFSGAGEADELAGQLVADLVEAQGYSVYFGGGGVANDEILAEVGEHHPDVLLMFASAASDAPNIRVLNDTIRNIGACPNLQVVVGGGIFNRAEGLAEEIGADLWAKTPVELVDRLATEPGRRATAEQRTVGRTRRTKKSLKMAAA
jgi:methanogenic corrinoid protein MtbC1